ncbi:ABC transporter ATP-binding protein [Oceanobacillus manasiensis]|uniref:ABC transporter ATP-binding protein n=1 Tax=Oceanobacillus manasiensis TaxID=586413 RepID=UPI0005A988E6|nr:ABC transporter ATP-binding protein [Oceanobacillus manasiensis]
MNVAEFRNVTKERKDFTLKNINMTIPRGFVTGFIGPNGSGKTTTIQMLMDLLHPDFGVIKLYNESNKNYRIKQKIGFVYDELYMYDEFNIKRMKSFLAPIYENWNEKLFEKYVKEFELPLTKKLKHFSKGMKMKCSLLFALSHEHEFIIMDEPTSGLDPIFRRELLDQLQELMLRDNQTIFLSTHITTDLERIADYIVFIYKGEIIFQKSMLEIQEQFHIVKGKREMIDADTETLFSGIKMNQHGFSALFEGDPTIFDDYSDEIVIENASLEDIMYFLTREGHA